ALVERRQVELIYDMAELAVAPAVAALSDGGRVHQRGLFKIKTRLGESALGELVVGLGEQGLGELGLGDGRLGEERLGELLLVVAAGSGTLIDEVEGILG